MSIGTNVVMMVTPTQRSTRRLGASWVCGSSCGHDAGVGSNPRRWGMLVNGTGSAMLIVAAVMVMVLVMGTTTLATKPGQHEPFGAQAVNYLFSADGTFRTLPQPLIYSYNYYATYDYPPDHPYDEEALVAMANGSVLTTALDANAHLLGDLDHSGEVDDWTSDDAKDRGAFFEHAGRGANNELKGNPFSNFWYDDNSLALLLCVAYGTPLPAGLSSYDNFTRWRILAGPDPYWEPYENPMYMDTEALDGLYYLTIDQPEQARTNWETLVNLSSASWNEELSTFEYPGTTENYHEALFRILTDSLLIYETPASSSSSAFSASSDDDLLLLLLQHSVALRRAILQKQQPASQDPRDETNKTGWLSSISDPESSLMNTESIVLGAFALSSQQYANVYEVGPCGGGLPVVSTVVYNNTEFFARASQQQQKQQEQSMQPVGHAPAASAGPMLQETSVPLVWECQVNGQCAECDGGKVVATFVVRSWAAQGATAGTVELAVADGIWQTDIVAVGSAQWQQIVVDAPIAAAHRETPQTVPQIVWHGDTDLDVATIEFACASS